MSRRNTAEDLIRSIDFKMLREQKKRIFEIQEILESPVFDGLWKDQNEALEGILNLIDSIQDLAVDQLGYSEKDVFSFDTTGGEYELILGK